MLNYMAKAIKTVDGIKVANQMSKEREESLPQQSVQRNKRKTTEWERLEISSRKLEIPREHFMQRWAQ